MEKAYDLFVIGTGTAAVVASHGTAAAGWKVAVADYRPFGGTCALRGCDPKKILIGAVQVIDDVRRMAPHGVSADEAHVGWRALIKFKRGFTGPIPAKQEKQFAAKGIDTYHERARFTGRNTVEVDGKLSFQVRHVLLATGARPAPLAFPGEEHVITNEEFLELEELPKRVVLVGGGYIAAEFSHIAARAGAQVTILQRGDRMLPQFEPELVTWLMGKFRQLDIDVRTQHSVTGVAKTEAGFVVTAESNGKTTEVIADLVVHAAGRIPDIDGVDLDAAGVERDHRGRLKLNAFLQSVSNPSVYAAGDAAQNGPPLTPVAGHDAKIVVRNLLEGNRHTPDYKGVPSVAFTIPPIARVGLSEQEARERGLKVRIKSQSVSDWYSARRIAETVYGFKVLVDESTDRIIGAHLVGPHAEEVINIFGLSIRNDLTATALKNMMFAYPTGASDIAYML